MQHIMQRVWKHLPLVTLLLVCTLLASLAQSMTVQAAPVAAPLAVPGSTSTIFINEFHYDDASTDDGEFIEIAGPAGTDLTGWTIVLYNGSNGAIYDTDALPSTIPDTGCPYGFVTVPYAGTLQNGAPDGIALVNNGTLVQFLSYEGSFAGVGGAVGGQTSTNIGVSESGSETEGQSLQLTGTGTTYGNFTWTGPTTASPGAINAGQNFGVCSDVPPAVNSVTPTAGSTGVALNSDLTVSFNEAVTVTDPWFTIQCTTSGSHTATVSGGPQDFTLNPDIDFVNEESCTVTLTASQIVDQDGTPQAMAENYVWSFDTAINLCTTSAVTKIHVVQGNGPSSPLNNASVIVRGVVVGDYQGSGNLSGFYLQEEDNDTDGDAATSEGIFVFSNLAVNAGDVVGVQGTVLEFVTSGTALTELSPVTQLQVCATGASVTPIVVDLPVSSVEEWERYEGMVINIPEALTVTENFTLGRFGEVHLSTGGRLYQPTHLFAPGAPAQAQLAANNRHRILLDDARSIQNPDPIIYPSPYLSATNTLRAGDTTSNITGILDHRFGFYRIQPLSAVTFTPSNPRPTTPPAVGGTLTVVSANVLNYFTTLDASGNECGPAGFEQECRGANSSAEFTRQRTKIINGLAALNADVVGLLEIENNPTAAVADLVAGLNAQLGAGTYAYIDTGYIGTDAIKVALIYKPATVTPVGNYAILDTTVDARFLDTKNRPVLAQTFQENATTERFTVAVNHLKSKGSDCNDVGDPDTGDGQGNCNVTRTNAADALVDWLAGDPTASGDPDFLIIGDLNSYAMEDPITTITAAGYVDLLKRFHGQAAYSYVFDGQAGYLDHALASTTLDSQVTGAADWHVNTDEPVALDYNLDFQSVPQQTYLYTPEPYRFSDHDPVVIGLDLESETTITIVKDARPDNIRNFRFTGDFGNFRLDDPGFDDRDPFGTSNSFTVQPGTYTIAEDVPHFWHLTNVSCTGGSTTVDLATQSVAITVIAGQHVTCTFTNEYGSAIWVDKYFDRNADGIRNWESGLPGWKMSLYNSAGTLVAADTTNIFGKVHFWDIAPGTYTLCETQKNGWFNSQPGTTDPAYNQPCYSLNIGPAELWYVEFGNHRHAHASSASVAAPNAPTSGGLEVEAVDDESYEDDGSFVDPDLHRPAQGQPGPLFLPQVTR